MKNDQYIVRQFAHAFNFLTIMSNAESIRQAVEYNRVTDTVLKDMNEILKKYEITYNSLNTLILPEGMRFECYEGVLILVNNNEVIYHRDYRLASYDAKSLPPHPYPHQHAKPTS